MLGAATSDRTCRFLAHADRRPDDPCRVARAKGSISSAERTALVARERILAARRGVYLFRLLRERRGVLTLAQIRRMSRLLTDHADALYRRADGVERGAVAARVPKALSLAALASRVGQVGQVDQGGDDPVTQSTVDRLVEVAATLEGRPTTPAAIRAAAIEVLRLAEAVAGARDLPRRRPPARPRGGRHPNVPLDRLLHYAAKRGITDAILADELDRQEVPPDGPGSERPRRARWMAILKSARARRRRATTTAT
jgi:hypothetical protein